MLYCKCMSDTCPHPHFADRKPPEQTLEPMEYGTIVPGVTCPACGGELVHTSIGALCEWDEGYVPIVGDQAVVIEDGDDEDSDSDGRG